MRACSACWPSPAARAVYATTPVLTLLPLLVVSQTLGVTIQLLKLVVFAQMAAAFGNTSSSGVWQVSWRAPHRPHLRPQGPTSSMPWLSLE